MNYERYIEVFGGGGWVLFHKPPRGDFEVFNDFDGNLVNLYRCVRDKPQVLIDKLHFTLNSREDFAEIKTALKHDADMDEMTRAALFYQLVVYSYGHDRDSFACRPNDMWTRFPLIHQAHRRLRRVIIENRDFEKLIGQYDRPVSFFYCDPPYYMTEDYYAGGFTRTDHKRLHDALMGIGGKFLLSYNDCPEIRELYNDTGLFVQPVVRPNNLKLRYEAGAQFAELLIANYDMAERKRTAPQQLCLPYFEQPYFGKGDLNGTDIKL